MLGRATPRSTWPTESATVELGGPWWDSARMTERNRPSFVLGDFLFDGSSRFLEPIVLPSIDARRQKHARPWGHDCAPRAIRSAVALELIHRAATSFNESEKPGFSNRECNSFPDISVPISRDDLIEDSKNKSTFAMRIWEVSGERVAIPSLEQGKYDRRVEPKGTVNLKNSSQHEAGRSEIRRCHRRPNVERSFSYHSVMHRPTSLPTKPE